MGMPASELPPDAYQDALWTEVLPWLAHYPPGSVRELADLSPSPDWWFTESPALTTLVVDHFDLCVSLARVLIARHADAPFQQLLPTLSPNMPLSALVAGSRVRTTFQRLEAVVVRDLADLTIKELFSTRGTGPGTVKDAVTALIAAAIASPPDPAVSDRAGDPLTQSTAAVPVLASHSQLLEDLIRLAHWRHIRRASDTPLFNIVIENEAPDEVQDAVLRINSLSATDVQPPRPRADPVEEFSSVVMQLNQLQRILLQDRFLAPAPKSYVAIAADLGVSVERVEQAEEQLVDLFDRTFHLGTTVGDLLATIRIEIQPVAAISRLIALHPELANEIPRLAVPLWHVLDRLDNYFEVTDGWAAAPNTDAARDHTRIWLEDAADQYGVVPLSVLSAATTMPGSELRAWLQWCGYPLHDDHVITRTRSVSDLVTAALSISGHSLSTPQLLELIDRDDIVETLGDLLETDGRFILESDLRWSLVDWKSETVHQDMAQTTEPIARREPFGTRGLYRHRSLWRLRITITREHLRGTGFPLPVAVAGLVACEQGGTVELESRLGMQVIRWTGALPASASIRRFLDDLAVEEGREVFLDLHSDGTFDVKAVPGTEPGATLLAIAATLVGSPANQQNEAATSALAIAVGLEPDAKPRHILSVYQQRGEEDIVALLETVWTRPAASPLLQQGETDALDAAALASPIPLRDDVAEEVGDERNMRTEDQIPVPQGYRSVGWIRPDEAHAVLEAYRTLADAPVIDNEAIVGWARYVPAGQALGRPAGADVQLVMTLARRERPICWITRAEAVAVGQAASQRRTVPLSTASAEWTGRVEYFPPESAAAVRFQSVTRLLRVRDRTATEVQR